MAFTIENNQPSAGCVRWSNLHMQYLGTNYTIINGYTNYPYIYWTPSSPTNLIVSNSFPTLGKDDCLVFLNKSGTAITVPGSTVLQGDLIVPGSIVANAIAANTITGDKIAASTITASNIASGTIVAGNIATGAITADKVAANAIGATAIAANAITSDKIVTDAITTAKIASSAVTANEIASNTITGAKIAAATITASNIASNTITTTQLASSVGSGLDISSNNSITIKADKDYVVSRGENLVTNGTALLGDNTNFSSFTLDKSDSYGAGGSFKDSTYNTGRLSDEFIPVNPSLIYRLNLYAKCNPHVGAKYYTGITCYDVDKLSIDNFMCQGRPGTLTTLSQDLKAGDTKIYLTSAVNWVDGTQTYHRGFIFWNYSNAGGYAYGTTYSRNYYLDKFNTGAINLTGNYITLKTAWTGSTITAGTKLSQTYPEGGSYIYIGASNTAIPSTWTNYTGTIGGNSTNKFRLPTAYVKLVFLNNRDINGSTVWYSNISFGLDNVTSDKVISSINVTPETVKIQASKVDLIGYATFSSLSNAGQSVIDGGNITTGTIDASKINVTNINASNIKSGKISADMIDGDVIIGKSIQTNELDGGGTNAIIDNGIVTTQQWVGGEVGFTDFASLDCDTTFARLNLDYVTQYISAEQPSVWCGFEVKNDGDYVLFQPTNGNVGIKMYSKTGSSIFQDHKNNNVSISAYNNGKLYLGYYSTNGIVMQNNTTLQTGRLYFNTDSAVNYDYVWFDDSTNTFHLVGDSASSTGTTGNANLQAGTITANTGYAKLGKTPAFIWSGTINSSSYATITHNLGYRPIVKTNGSVGNIILTTNDIDVNNLKVYAYSSGGNSWTGTIYLY